MNPRSKHLVHHFLFLIGLWSAAILSLFILDYRNTRRNLQQLALIEARTYMGKEQAISRWVASHGGIYVPVSGKMKPDPTLSHVAERDILTPQGRVLTLMSPAHLIRDLMTEYDRLHHIRGHITSSIYLREDTVPDAWEKLALGAIEAGRPEVVEFCDLGDEAHLRMMQPLKIEVSCLKCHISQGYEVGDSKGGVSIAIPMRHYHEYGRKEITSYSISLVLLWGMGIGGFWLAASQLSNHMKKKDRTEALLKVAQKNYQALVDNSLTGIYIVQDYKIQFCNAKFAEIHGYRPEEMIDKDTKDLVHPLDRAYAREMHKNRMQGLKVPEEYEIRCITADGRTIWVQRRNSIIKHNGRPAVLGNEIDITEKKEAEEALMASEAQLKRLVARLIRRHEFERKNIALEIHEDVAQTLSAIKMNIEELLAADPRGSSPELVAMQPIVERIRTTIHMIRGLTKRLSPIMLDDLGIKTAISTLCTEVMENCKGSKITTRLNVDEGIIPGELKIVIYRVLEELLDLSSRYCMAHHWAVALSRKNGKIELVFDEIGPNTVRPLEEMEWQMGMAVIHNRAESSGGALTMHVREENKRTITVSWTMPVVAM